jgi:protease-4
MRPPLRASLALCLVLLPGAASAQLGSTPTDGVRLPETSITNRDDALSLELNPAGLAFMQGWGADLAFTTVEGDALAGAGVFGGGTLFGRLGLGGAVQWLENPAFGGDITKFTLGAATHFGGRLALGLGFHFFDSDTDVAVDRFTSWDFGLQLRVAEWLGLGFGIRDFNAPRLGAGVIGPRYQAGLALRFFEGRLVVETEGLYEVTGARWFARGRLSGEPIEGIGLFAEAQTRELGPFEVGSVQAGVSFSLGRVGVTGALFASGEDSLAVSGGAVGLHLTSPPERTIFTADDVFAAIELSGGLPERGREALLFGSRGRSFLDLLLYLDDLRADEHVSGVVLTLDSVAYGLAQHWELRRVIESVRAEGKTVIVYLRTAGFGDLYLASAADRVYLHPGSVFFPRGLSTTLTYLGDLFRNVGVLPEFVRIGEYKSAPESLTEAAPSEATLEAVNAFYGDAFDEMVGAIAAGRDLEEADVLAALEGTPYAPSEARGMGFVDELAFPDELNDRIRSDLARPVRIVPGYDPNATRDYAWTQPPAIAVIYVDGDIAEGTSGEAPLLGEIAGNRTLVPLIEAAAQSSSVRAIVLRVNSPGGSAWASELIWRAVQQASLRKPVIVSMGNVAASGGYYVAMGGTRVLAAPTTLTGSIGIFSGHFSLRRLFETIGVHRFPLLWGDRADLFGISSDWTDEDRDAAFRHIQILYDTFLERVAQNRETTTEAIDAVARGRIWSGTRALENGLVDELGGLLDAIRVARAEAGLDPDDDVRILQLPERSALGPLSMVLGGLQTSFADEDWATLATWAERLGLGALIRFPLLYGGGEPAARLPFEFVP